MASRATQLKLLCPSSGAGPSRRPHAGLHKISTALPALPLRQKALALSIVVVFLLRALLIRSPPHDFDAPAPPNGNRARALQDQLEHLSLSGATQAADALRQAALEEATPRSAPRATPSTARLASYSGTSSQTRRRWPGCGRADAAQPWQQREC